MLGMNDPKAKRTPKKLVLAVGFMQRETTFLFKETNAFFRTWNKVEMRKPSFGQLQLLTGNPVHVFSSFPYRANRTSFM